MSTQSPPSVADEIAKLSKLRSEGAITDAEFQQQKEKLFGGSPQHSTSTSPHMDRSTGSAPPSDWSALPLRKKWWFQATMTLLLIPVGVVLMLFCTAYQKRKGEIVRVGKGTKAVMIVLWSIIWAYTAFKLIGPYNLGRAAGTVYRAVDNTSASTSPSQHEGTLAACDDDETKATVKQIVEQDGQAKVLDMGAFEQVSCPALSSSDGSCLKTGDRERYCNVRLYLSSGAINAKFHMFYGPSGRAMVEVQKGSWVDWSKMK